MIRKLFRKGMNFYQRLTEEDNIKNSDSSNIVILGDLQIKCHRCHNKIIFRGSELKFYSMRNEPLSGNQEHMAIVRSVCKCHNHVQVTVTTSCDEPPQFEAKGSLLEKCCDIYVNQ